MKVSDQYIWKTGMFQPVWERERLKSAKQISLAPRDVNMIYPPQVWFAVYISHLNLCGKTKKRTASALGSESHKAGILCWKE